MIWFGAQFETCLQGCVYKEPKLCEQLGQTQSRLFGKTH